MNDKRELFNWLDSEIFSTDAAMDYARGHLNEIIDSAYQNCVRKVWTTQGYDLGIANPDLILHRVIGGRKKGRIVKKIPQNANYSEIGYDKDGAPLYFKNINIYGSEDTYFFFRYDGFTWAMELESVNRGETRRRISTYNIKKFRFDEKGRIHSYADISRSGSAIVTVYEYPEVPEQPSLCHFYYYVTFMEATHDLKSDRTKVAQFSEYRYEISPDQKTITEYRKKPDGTFAFSRKIESSGKKSGKTKAAADSYEKFTAWLDAELEKEIPDQGGIYFDLFQPAEDGFGIYFSVTEYFDPDDDDWAYCVKYCSDNMHMVQTSGLMEWEDALQTAAKLIRKYLREGKYRSVLRGYSGIGTAFSDGEIVCLYAKKK